MPRLYLRPDVPSRMEDQPGVEVQLAASHRSLRDQPGRHRATRRRIGYDRARVMPTGTGRYGPGLLQTRWELVKIR